MSHTKFSNLESLRRGLVAALGIFALVLVTGKAMAAEPVSPIDDLKKALNTDRGLARVNQAVRERRAAAIRSACEALTSVGDLADALMIADWQLEIGESGGVRGDRQLWYDLSKRFHTRISTVLETKEPVRQEAACLLLADIGSNAESAARKDLSRSVLTPLTTTLAQLASDTSNELSVRLSAIQALGKLNPLLVIAADVRAPTPEASEIKPDVLNDQAAARAEARKRLDQAMAAIRSLLKPDNPVEARRGAARALTDLTRSVGEQDRAAERVAELQTMNDIEVYHAYTTLTQVAVSALTDADARVRETGVAAIGSVAKILDDRLQAGSPLDRYYLPNKSLPADQQKKLEEAQKNLGETIQREVRDLQTALGGAAATHKEGIGIGLGNLVRDPSPTVRLKAVDAIREMALLYRRVRPLERPTAPPPVPSGSQVKLQRPVVQVADKPVPAPSEPVLEGLQSAAASLPTALSDPHAKTRITAAEAIELLGPGVVAGVPGISESLVAALSDSDRFVRWAAARTIHKLGFVSAKDAVPALAKMLVDPDFDLQMVATTTLADYGPQAKAAVPNLIRAVERGDSDVKTNAMQTLAAIGTDGAAAVPATTRALRDAKPQTRKQAADLLGRFGSLAESAIPALKAATQDDNVDVRRSAAQAILNITRK